MFSTWNKNERITGTYNGNESGEYRAMTRFKLKSSRSTFYIDTVVLLFRKIC